jgi:hypothetical protein
MLHMTTNAQAAYIAATNMTNDPFDASQLAAEIQDNLDYMDKMSGPRNLLHKIDHDAGSIRSVPTTTLWGETYEDKTPFVKA